MSWTQILEDTETQSREIGVSQPFALRAEGSFTGKTITVESRRTNGTIGNPVDLDGQLSATDPNIVLGGIDDTVYRVTVNIAGLSIFWNKARPVQGG